MANRHLTQTVTGTTFGFYTSEEIRKLSVKQITSPITFDSGNRPVRGGLYDPALGPTTSAEQCPTCTLAHLFCPGHMGHVELVAPVYNPLLFLTMYKILRAKCFYCHRFKMPVARARVYRVKMLLCDTNQVAAAMNLDTELAACASLTDRQGNKVTPAEELEARERVLHNHELRCADMLATGRKMASTHAREYRRQIMAEFMKNIPTKTCANCQAPATTLRKDGYTKIFLRTLNKKTKAKVMAMGLSATSALEEEDSDGAGPGADSDDDSVSEDEEDDDDVWAGKDKTKSKGPAAAKAAKPSKSGDETAFKFVPPSEVQKQMQLLWEADEATASMIWGPHINTRPHPGWQIFFLDVIPVAPPRFRPPAKLGEETFEHPQNVYLAKILNLNERMMRLAAGKSDTAENGDGKAEAKVPESARRDPTTQQMQMWIEMQDTVNMLIDSSKVSGNNRDAQAGIRQLLEKKEGLFRQNMMGKRVNFAARSVISPDPFIGTDEIGVPVRFAKVLTYPQPVAPWNVVQLRQMVINGPDVHPGATHVEDESGKRIDLSTRNRHQREAIAKTLMTQTSHSAALTSGLGVKRVWRHLLDNDVLLVNRQPTLHKPSIMAHRVRVLRNASQQTIRMHYANCNTYNADFDGDEMNLHFPQDEISRAEAYTIAATPYQYTVPTSGKPIRGLIQDHVGMGVLLTMRDTFLTRDQYHHLVYAAVMGLPRFQKDPNIKIHTLPPTILKPKPLWTGKQVISSLMHALTQHIPKPASNFNLDSTSKLGASTWGIPSSRKHLPDEHMVIFRDNELLVGVMDKNQLGASAFGLVHSVFDLYGAEDAGALLTALGRLLTIYLQQCAVTCGIDDLVLTRTAEQKRAELVAAGHAAGVKAAATFAEFTGAGFASVNVPEALPGVRDALKLKLTGGEAAAEGADAVVASKLDNVVKGAVAEYHSKVIGACLPNEQLKLFPANNFSLMIMSGAKGSLVNHAMIACGLGQQELEGRRVPMMVSGKTLPSFLPFDPAPRAGGFISDRFITGLRPQDYFFHCMSGREGLVDTAVKTSRSGYLQRCLMKHLETLSVQYDHTVRDADGGVVQMLYGEDGLDVTRCKYIEGADDTFTFMARNQQAIVYKYGLSSAMFERYGLDTTTAETKHQELHAALQVRANPSADLPVNVGDEIEARWMKNPEGSWHASNLADGWAPAKVVKIREPEESGKHKETGRRIDIVYRGSEAVVKKVPLTVKGAGVIVRPTVPDPVSSTVSLASCVGAVSERLQAALTSYIDRDPHGVLAASKAARGKKHSKGDLNVLDPKTFSLVMWMKYLRSSVDAGEPVGTLAAQSVGEPSTQMTLNTFHLAGHGGVNVTLGIPRLREIVMTASANIKTPSMTVPMRPGVSQAGATAVARDLDLLRFSDLIAGHRVDGGIVVTERYRPQAGMPAHLPGVAWQREYVIRLYIVDAHAVKRVFGMSFRDVAAMVGAKYVTKLLSVIAADKRKTRKSADGKDEEEAEEQVGASAATREKRGGRKGANADAEEGGHDADAGDAAADAAGSGESDSDSDAGDEEQGTLRTGHKKEIAGYGVEHDSDADGEADGEEDVEQRSADDEAADGEEEERPRPSKSAKAAPKALPAQFIVEVPASVKRNPSFADCRANSEEQWIEVVLSVPASEPKLLMLYAAERAATATLLRSTKGIKRAMVVKQKINGTERWCIQTEGVNMEAFWSLADECDVNVLDTNDIYSVLQHYGVEAARAAIVKEVKSVFGAYGIAVDTRHLGLIADYMTFGGGFRPFNRQGMDAQGSPYLKMSFETTTRFLTGAALHGEIETMASPSARLVCGQVVGFGTGAFSLMAPLA